MKKLSAHAAQVKALLLADDPASFSMYGEYELSGPLADRMDEIAYSHGYEAGLLLARGDTSRAQAIRRRLEDEFWELLGAGGVRGHRGPAGARVD